VLLQTGPRFLVPFALNAGFGVLLVVAGVAVAVRFGDGDRFGETTYRAIAAALGLFGLGLVALALDFAGTMAELQTGLDRPDGTPMEPTLVGEVGLAAPWETVALALFVAGAVAAVVGVGLLVREELGRS
jgi:ABC-type Na+ efflux pump permease subunit